MGTLPCIHSQRERDELQTELLEIQAQARQLKQDYQVCVWAARFAVPFLFGACFCAYAKRAHRAGVNCCARARVSACAYVCMGEREGYVLRMQKCISLQITAIHSLSPALLKQKTLEESANRDAEAASDSLMELERELESTRANQNEATRALRSQLDVCEERDFEKLFSRFRITALFGRRGEWVVSVCVTAPFFCGLVRGEKRKPCFGGKQG